MRGIFPLAGFFGNMGMLMNIDFGDWVSSACLFYKFQEF
jgi:hypothetical protein